MIRSNQIKQRDLEVSAGLLVGYLIAGLINMMAFDKSWQEAFSDGKIILGIAGLALSYFLFLRSSRQSIQSKDDDS